MVEPVVKLYSRLPLAAARTSRVGPAPATISPLAYASAAMTGAGSGCSHTTPPVAGSRARTDPTAPAPAIVVLPPATYRTPPANAAEATLASPQVGHGPPNAISRCQTGPAARLPRSKV